KIIKEQLLVEKVRAQKFRDITVSRREVEAFYNTYKDSLPQKQQTVDISHILMTVEPSDEAQAKAYEKISTIYDKLKNGANFTEMAKQYSEDPGSAQRGGDLGMISRGDFVTEFESAAFKLNDGEMSDIVQTQFGYHIIKMIERRGEKIHTRHILIQLSPTQEDEKRVINKLKEVRQRILDGADFGEMALKHSDDDNVKSDKGHLGVFEVDKLAIEEFKSIVRNLEPGEISQPFKTQYGYHIVRLNDKQSNRKFSLEDDWQQIRQFAINMKMQEEYQDWIEKLKEKTAIEIRN
ncbi:MAG: parvulin peptidyl-prolyl isomerase, partial [Caldithrix sp.]|nr:parvulin peptidyl-prolyl isomerase [Caldithrix sp.]